MSFTFLHSRSVMVLRIALGVIFFWFGILKLFNASPAQEITTAAFPFLGQSELVLFFIALLEILIGVALLANRFVKSAAIIMVVYLLIEMGAVLFTQGFAPRFPILSLAGEFALKNLVLAAAGLVLIAEKQEKQPEHHSKQPETDYAP